MFNQNLTLTLKTAKPRECSGSQTAGRYEFQSNFGILKLLELHENGQDFRIVFDLFDDLMVLNSADKPTEVRLYQVKSKDPGEWSTSNLCAKVGATPPRSYVARMYAHLDIFGGAVQETGFVTNAPFDIKLVDGSNSSGTHHRISGSEIHDDEITKITKAVLADINPCDVHSWIPKLILIRTTLSVHGQKLVITGRLYEHFQTFHGFDAVNVSAVYETLYASIQSRTSFAQEGLEQAVLIERKSLTRDELANLLQRALLRPQSFLSDWDIIRADLDKVGVGSARPVRLKSMAIQYHQNRQQGYSKALSIRDFIATWKKNNSRLIEDCDTIISLADIMKESLSDTFGYTDIQLQAAMIVEAYEASTQLSPHFR